MFSGESKWAGMNTMTMFSSLWEFGSLVLLYWMEYQCLSLNVNQKTSDFTR